MKVWRNNCQTYPQVRTPWRCQPESRNSGNSFKVLLTCLKSRINPETPWSRTSFRRSEFSPHSIAKIVKVYWSRLRFSRLLEGEPRRKARLHSISSRPSLTSKDETAAVNHFWERRGTTTLATVLLHSLRCTCKGRFQSRSRPPLIHPEGLVPSTNVWCQWRCRNDSVSKARVTP